MIVIPSVSIGNVPQLAMDLLIHTYDMELVETLDDEYMYPIAGPQDYSGARQEGVSTPIQIFSHEKFKLVQLRSPPLPNCQAKFLNLIQNSVDGPALVVGSANAGMRTTSLEAPKLIWCDADSIPKDIYESGYFSSAVSQFSAQGLVNYIYEGDNSENAVEVAEAIVEKLRLEAKPLVRPSSWQKFYGNEPPTSLEDGIYA